MLVRKGAAPLQEGGGELPEHGPRTRRLISDAGALTQLGAYLETLMPGSVSSDRHWHEEEDEFLYMIDGEAVLVEEHREETLRPGDAAVWARGTPNGHQVVNRSDAPCSYLIIGTRVPADVVHYPDLGRTCHIDGERWRVVDRDGVVLRRGGPDPVE